MAYPFSCLVFILLLYCKLDYSILSDIARQSKEEQQDNSYSIWAKADGIDNIGGQF